MPLLFYTSDPFFFSTVSPWIVQPLERQALRPEKFILRKSLFRIQIFMVDIINALMLYVLMSLVVETKLKPENMRVHRWD